MEFQYLDYLKQYMKGLQVYKYLVKHHNHSVVKRISGHYDTQLKPHYQFNHSLIERWEFNQDEHRWIITKTMNLTDFLIEIGQDEFEYRLYSRKSNY